MMLFRIIMVLFLLVIAAVPAWAGEKANAPIESSSAPVAEQMTMEEALAKVTIKAEDWIDDDMYHIRYTFTNPTDVHIEKDIACTIIRYDLHCPAKDSIPSAHRYNEGYSRLIIPPHSTYTTAISMKQSRGAVFNDLKYSNIYFDDDSYLHYAETPKMIRGSEKTFFSIIPVSSLDGRGVFAIQNNSSHDTITEIRNINLDFYHQGQRTCILHAEPISLNIKPGKTQIIDSFPTQAVITKGGTASDPFYPYSGPFYSMSMRINGVPHMYQEVFSPEDHSKSYSKEVVVSPFNTEYRSAQEPRPSDGTFYLDDDYLYAYFSLVNAKEKTLDVSTVQYQLLVDYLDQDGRFRLACYRIRLPQDCCLAPNEKRYFSFKAPLPSDLHKILPNIYPLRFLESHPELQSLRFYPIEKVPLPIAKEQYIVLDDIEIMQPTSLQEYFNHLF